MKSRHATILIAIAVLIILAAIFLMGRKAVAPVAEVPAPIAQQPIAVIQPATFAWNYEKADSLNPDGLPQTKVFLKVTYADGITQNKLIDTVDGSCNDLPDADKDSVPHSTTMQCYAAGFGYDFKVTRGQDAYLVQRKEFEEASPDYHPPVTTYKVVATIPFSGK